jgi:hypothetical protein
MAGEAVVELFPGVFDYATAQGQHYLIAGIVRGGLTDAQVTNVLSKGGFADVTMHASPPPHWPTENPLSLGEGERWFRASGTWTKSDSSPTAWSTPGGAVLMFQMWAAPQSVTAIPAELVVEEPAIVPDRPIVDYGVVPLPPLSSSPDESTVQPPALPAHDQLVGASPMWPLIGVLALASAGYVATAYFIRMPRVRTT